MPGVLELEDLNDVAGAVRLGLGDCDQASPELNGRAARGRVVDNESVGRRGLSRDQLDRLGKIGEPVVQRADDVDGEAVYLRRPQPPAATRVAPHGIHRRARLHRDPMQHDPPPREGGAAGSAPHQDAGQIRALRREARARPRHETDEDGERLTA